MQGFSAGIPNVRNRFLRNIGYSHCPTPSLLSSSCCMLRRAITPTISSTMSSDLPRVGRASFSNPFPSPRTPQQGTLSERVAGRGVRSGEGSWSVPAARAQRLDLADRKPQTSPEKVGSGTRSPDAEAEKKVFDLCPPPEPTTFRLKRSLLEENRENRRRAQSAPRLDVPRPGMVLLKNFLSHQDQVAVIRKCRELGIGTGGFYQPGYTDGAKLHLQMMCLGKDWNPQSKEYHETRLHDAATPPQIPEEFKKLVESAMQASHDLIRRNYAGCPEYKLPDFSPDLCIVNFYSNMGRLGIHRDEDESIESLRKGLPVVSFSVGDSADFLYGDSRDANETVKLDSGDVLIFGGKSRHIFHGVSKIHPQSAPKSLVEETNLRTGRLNLTFRQY